MKKKLKKHTSLEHDFTNLKRYGRADWRCRGCGENVMILLVLAQEAGIDLTEEVGVPTSKDGTKEDITE